MVSFCFIPQSAFKMMMMMTISNEWGPTDGSVFAGSSTDVYDSIAPQLTAAPDINMYVSVATTTIPIPANAELNIEISRLAH